MYTCLNVAQLSVLPLHATKRLFSGWLNDEVNSTTINFQQIAHVIIIMLYLCNEDN